MQVPGRAIHDRRSVRQVSQPCATNGVGTLDGAPSWRHVPRCKAVGCFSPIFLPINELTFNAIDGHWLDWSTPREQVKRYGTTLASTVAAAFLNRASHVRIMPGAPTESGTTTSYQALYQITVTGGFPPVAVVYRQWPLLGGGAGEEIGDRIGDACAVPVHSRYCL